MSIIGIIIAILVILILLLLVAVSFYFYRVAVFRQPKTFLMNNPDLAQITTDSEIPVAEPAWVDAQSFEIIELLSYDGLLLKGYYLPALSPTNKTVILAHGYTGTAKENMGSLAHFYHEKFGYNILMPDARGHGISEGNYIGFGWHERKDYLKWIALLIQRVGEDAQIVLHGISMGGATVLMTSGEQLPPQVKCVVADCGYTSAEDILSYQVKRMYHLPPFPFVHLTSLVCKLKAGYFFSEASALKQVEHAQRPILFIHGAEDTFVPTEMVHRLYNQCPQYKELLVIPAAGHGTAYSTDSVTYIQQVDTFVRRFVQ
ncbi:alpha/beta hydrolase [Dictyobacter arantiisoli]|uniref:Alpha/beta hydrolase n=1 Tax=Dictyobacter arantiisoli TaxID=2014874 RepID=A0A5A5TFU3_9CHLR|nr:alpha/beta hydrolase [Dictyobacter arantiisoli]GCF10441.1 alpha/beta hydrolase [Dictyobacter arantiisoli]